MTIVAFEKEVSLRLFDSTHGSFKLEKKHLISINGKQKFKRILFEQCRRRKLQVTKAAFKGLDRFVFFTAGSLPCS